MKATNVSPSFHQNSFVSPFLQLPLEIRLQIYQLILGNRTIHIRLAMGEIISKPWRHVVCQHGHSKHLEEQRLSFSTACRPTEEWEPGHRICRWQTYYNPDTKKGSDYWDDERMHLRVLRCCRQMYAEANPILWSTNTFSIHDHRTLKQFMAERDATQKRSIRTLRLRFDLKRRLLHYRRSFLTPELMDSLTGLNTLVLILEDEFPARLVHSMAMTGKSLSEFGGNRIDAGLETLALLPLRRVSVEVHTPQLPSGEEDPLTEGWRREYADSVRSYLLGRRTRIEAAYQKL